MRLLLGASNSLSLAPPPPITSFPIRFMKTVTVCIMAVALLTGVRCQAICTQGDCANGFGHFVWQSGEKYIGNWQSGKMCGHGVFYWTDGRKYIGEWLEGKLHGRGTMFYADGKIKCGRWEQNRFVELLRPEYALNADNLRHGSDQIRMMLIDRPRMRGWVNEGDTVWNWLQRKFAGEDIHYRIYWQAKGTESFVIPPGVQAAHCYPTDIHEALLWVAPLDNPEAMWAGAVFELFNITNHDAFEAIERDAMLHYCNREQYIMRYAELEYQAARQTARFYRQIWQPYCQNKGLKSSGQHWFLDIPPTFAEWIALYKDPQGYPWVPYSGYYDRLVKSVVERY